MHDVATTKQEPRDQASLLLNHTSILKLLKMLVIKHQDTCNQVQTAKNSTMLRLLLVLGGLLCFVHNQVWTAKSNTMLRLLLVLGDLLCRHLCGSNEPFVRSFACSKNRTSSTKCAHKLDLVNEFKSVAHPKRSSLSSPAARQGTTIVVTAKTWKIPTPCPKCCLWWSCCLFLPQTTRALLQLEVLRAF